VQRALLQRREGGAAFDGYGVKVDNAVQTGQSVLVLEPWLATAKQM
jgi:hypothetical protein